MVGINDLIPGLPDEIVESLIWPRVRRHVEEVKGVQRYGPDLIGRLQLICSLAQTCRKWRHLVRHSKPWGGYRLLMHYWAPRYWATHSDIIAEDFVSIMFFLPPLDIFYQTDKPSLSTWLREWMHEFKENEIEFYLQLYVDQNDVCGRLRRWKEWRNTDSEQRFLAWEHL